MKHDDEAAVLAEARRLAYQFDLTYLRERNTCASEAEARTAGWLAVARASRPREAASGAATHFYVAVDGYTISWHRSRDDADAVVSRTPRAVVIESAPAMPQPEACPRLRWLAEMLDRHAQIENGDPENGPSLDSSRLADEIAARFATPASAAGREGAVEKARGFVVSAAVAWLYAQALPQDSTARACSDAGLAGAVAAYLRAAEAAAGGGG